MSSRRHFLRKVGLAGGGVALGLLAMPRPPEPLAALESVDRVDATDGVVPAIAAELDDDVIDDEDASPVALWQYRRTRDGFAPTSPINVVLPVADRETPLEDAMAVLDDAGWKRSPEEYARYAWNRVTETYEFQHATAAETHFGTSGRFHVRCWEFEGVVSMQVHEDSRALPRHSVPGYDRARGTVERLYADAGWRVVPDALSLDNESGDHGGDATVIEPEGSR